MIRLIKQANNLHRLEVPFLNTGKSTGITSIWFSYETPIAFYINDNIGWRITKNIWSSTTGKHLNMIDDDKSIRIDNHEFNKLLTEALQ